MPLSELSRVALLSDGAARAVDLFQLTDWAGVLDLLTTSGPRGLIERVRRVELGDIDTTRWPRNKISDDATAIYCDRLYS
jgi:hypothetical protein